MSILWGFKQGSPWDQTCKKAYHTMFTFSSSNRHCSNLLASYIGLNFVDPIRDNACFDFWQKMQFWVNCWPNSALPDICSITAVGWCNPAISVDLAPTSHQKPTSSSAQKKGRSAPHWEEAHVVATGKEEVDDAPAEESFQSTLPEPILIQN